ERMGAVLADGLDRRGDAGAIDEADQLAELERRGDRPLGVVFAADVAGDEAAPGCLGDRLAPLGLQIGDDDLAAMLGEHPDRAFAEARCAAGDDEDLACDVHVLLRSIQRSAARARALMSSTLPVPLMRRYAGASTSPEAAQRS